MWHDVQSCPSCRQTFENYARAERLLAHAGDRIDQPSQHELGLFAQRVVQQALQSAETRQSGFPAFFWRVALPTSVLALVVAFALLWRGPEMESSQLQARHAQQGEFTLRAFCHLTDVTGQQLVRSLSSAPSPQEVATCSPGSVVSFAATALKGGYLSVFRMLGPQRELLPVSDEVAELGASVQMQVIDFEWRQLAANEEVKLLFVLSPHPLSTGQLKQAWKDSASLEDFAAELDVWVVERTISAAAPIDGGGAG